MKLSNGPPYPLLFHDSFHADSVVPAVTSNCFVHSHWSLFYLIRRRFHSTAICSSALCCLFPRLPRDSFDGPSIYRYSTMVLIQLLGSWSHQLVLPITSLLMHKWCWWLPKLAEGGVGKQRVFSTLIFSFPTVHLLLCLLQAGIASKERWVGWKWHGLDYCTAKSDRL